MYGLYVIHVFILVILYDFFFYIFENKQKVYK